MKKCFLLGGGPSLQNFDFNQIKDHFTIGINKAFTQFPTDIIYMMDAKLYRYLCVDSPKNEKQRLEQLQWSGYQGRKMLLSSAKRNWKSVIEIIKTVKGKQLSLDINQGIYGGTNSGFGGLMLAIALGYKEIYLLGYDFECTDGKTHWHDGYDNQTLKRQEAKQKKFMGVFVQFASIIKDEGISVYNLNPNSILECFPKITLQKVLNDNISKE